MAKKVQNQKLVLEAQPREVLGKKVKQLRKQGLTPANVFGPKFKSISITVNAHDFLSAYKVARETGIVYVKVGNEEIPTLIKNLQKHPLNPEILHVDFRKIDLKQKIETAVPVEVVGESVAVVQLGGVLLKQKDTVTLEALPEDIPQHIEVDISTITELDQAIKVSDLKKSGTYEIKDDPETVLVSVIAHKEESVTPETTAVETEVIGEVPAEEGAEGEAAPAESGESKPEEETKE